jgi:hypothetical protein
MRRHLYVSLLSFFIASILLGGCKNDVNAIVRSLYGKKIDFNWSKQTIKADTIIEGLEIQTPLKVVAYIDSSLCTPCFMNYLDFASDFIEKYGSDNIVYMCIIQPRNISDLQDKMAQMSLKGVEVILDKDEKYKKRNSIDQYASLITVFLLDSDNRIKLVGDPLRSKKINDLYDCKVIEFIDELERTSKI